MSHTVSVPAELEPLFQRAQEFVGAYFGTLYVDPAHGTISIGGQRYVLMRAASLSVEWYATITHLYRDQGEAAARAVARSLLYDLAYAIGAADARAFHAELGLHEPIEKLSAGPVHFAHTGWARVAILPASHPTADADFLLVYDHPYSFEADAWSATGKHADFPVCVMSAGYSAGWCTASFGLPLVAVEICCKATDAPQCRFVMAPPERIADAITAYLHDHPTLARSTTYEIPGFFQRKQAEDELRERELQYRSIFEGVTDTILIVGLDGQIVAANAAAERLYGRPRAELVGLHVRDVTAPSAHALLANIETFPPEGVSGETLGLAAEGHVFEVEFHAAAFGYRRQPHILVVVNDISARKRIEAEHLRLQAQLVHQNARLREELQFARTVQESLLPQGSPWRADQLHVAVWSRAVGEVSRDFYVYADLGNARMLVALGKVSGKGVAAALVMALVVSAIESEARFAADSTALFAALHARLAERLRACELFVALQVLVIDPHQRAVVLANAGMPPVVLLREAQAQMIPLVGVPLGIGAQPQVEQRRLDLLPGDQLVLHSDGVVEAQNPQGELWGYTRLLAALTQRALHAQPEQLADHLLAQLAAFMGNAERRDDQTVLVIKPFGVGL